MILVMNLLEVCDCVLLVWVCYFVDVGWSRNSIEINIKIKYELIGKELVFSFGWCLNICVDNDD